MTRSRGIAREWDHLVYRCPEPHCYFAREIKEPIAPEHKCPQGNGTTKVGWTVYGPSLLEKTWFELDVVTHRLMTKTSLETDRGYAQGLAFTLALFMAPHLTTPNDVAREAKKRWEMKQAGEEYTTPGLGERRYEPPPGDHKLSRQTEQRAKVSAAPKPKRVTWLTDEQVEMVKAAAGMFSAADLAGMYEVPVEVIESLL